MEANDIASAGEEVASVPLAQSTWTALEQGWTVVQDDAKVDLELRNKVGTELNEEVEDGISYIWIVRHAGGSDEEIVKDEVQVKLKAEKVQKLRAGDATDWVRGAPQYVQHGVTSADAPVGMFTLKLQPCYKKELSTEGGHLYTVKVEVTDIMWDGNMARNDNSERGFFVDMVDICLTPLWEGTDRIPISFSPPQPNASTEFQRGAQRNVGAQFGQKNTAGVGYGRTRSQASSSSSWITQWERNDDGTAILRWKLNMVCTGSASRILYNVASPTKGDWGLRGHVPKLPPQYENGSFTGLEKEHSAQWSVQASAFHDEKVRWKIEIAVRASTLKAAEMLSLKMLRNRKFRSVEIKPDRLLCLTSSSAPISWIIMFLVPALLAAAVAAWLLQGR